ncbi:MAG TPA: MarR family transcriptional regulator [Ilumatobacteraceae bacterium]|nr:MarR family transcriptional regulator [Ilumatobacteraceae bacterium]
MTEWLTDEQQRAWRSLQFMKVRLDECLTRQLAAVSGLSLPDYSVLVALTDREDGRMRLYELAEKLSWEKSRLSHHVTRMARRDLVVKERCDDDRRGAFVAITKHGRTEIAAAAPGHVATVRAHVVDPLSAEQLRSMGQICETILASLTPDA